ncbi:GNAT family N-acetyltransferase [Microbacterium sp. B35-04]|uniref:GNAT family N-acetyltransferase n=1 Tax=Microbacterium sp. B35-04 TaxID=1961716 RepID=UPI0019531E17|nr:GNAT family N-acetyltransferase [Microbacterium sp. B35-04]
MTFDIRRYRDSGDLELFLTLPYALNHEVADDLEQGRRRPEWTWLAIRDNRLVGRLALWAPVGANEPTQLDIFDTDASLPEDMQREIGASLLDAAHTELLSGLSTPPEYARYLAADWRDDPRSRRATEVLLELMESAGARFIVERLRLEWREGTPIAAPDARLTFRPFHSDNELIDLTTRALAGTLDAHSAEELATAEARAVALAQYTDEFSSYSSPREWWQVATLPSGEAVGFVFPARNSYRHIIAYVGVLPEHRGNGYIDGILSEGTRVLVAAGADDIRASTDLGNVPMAKSFARNGYVTFERLINMAWG